MGEDAIRPVLASAHVMAKLLSEALLGDEQDGVGIYLIGEA